MISLYETHQHEEERVMRNGFGKLKTAAVIAIGLALAAANANAANKDIVDTAMADGHFKTLVAALQAAGLVDTLKGPGPFTVFAPTDEAFAKLPPGTVESLLKPENKQKLVAILTYHVVPGNVMSSDLAGKDIMSKTVEGQTVHIVALGGVTVNDAKVTAADIRAENGVIHIIDTVLLPQ
jgi:uncharacterized surface protein with fasciclin (FAS1) repeats